MTEVISDSVPQPFKRNHCVDCGNQAMISDFNGRPINGMVGTTLVWVCLCDEEDNVKTRIGSLPICADCDPLTINPDRLIENLLLNPSSGLTSDAPELEMFPNKKIEIIKRYGD